MRLNRVIIVGILFAVLSLGTAYAGLFDAVTSIAGGGSSGGDDLDTFLVRAKTAEELINNSTKSMFKAIASDKEQAQLEAKQKKLNETTDPKEKEALQRELTESQLAVIKKEAGNEELQKEASKWSDKKKEHVANAFFNYALGALQAGLIVKDGKALVTNPANAVKAATKLGEVKDAIASLGGIASGSVTMISSLKTFMSAANISATIPKTATDKPKPQADVDD
ncbi:MAG TPA: hypothetical protein PLZ82_07510 [Smithellaceae bacterium]|jgi:hypothetical protein|nr:hypothetical protein [Syntrophaceae bacterium]NMC92644.1 hypothetical protein [Smithella sp.]OQC73293.1 MAG: hypothetical protein BWX45_00559 [Deltaproteobacteria bacterium ADurb.Bin002]HNV57165.1 hypothetical protein [Smithellaceae bacterium]MBP9532736.1 hypothetical protein [Syntrophaceae bacterium]